MCCPGHFFLSCVAAVHVYRETEHPTKKQENKDGNGKGKKYALRFFLFFFSIFFQTSSSLFMFFLEAYFVSSLQK